MKHLDVDEHLALADHEGAPGTAEHLAACEQCRAEAEHLSALKEGLASLPRLRPEEDLWPAVLEAIRAEGNPSLHRSAVPEEMPEERSGRRIVLGLAAAVLLVGIITAAALTLLGHLPPEPGSTGPTAARVEGRTDPILPVNRTRPEPGRVAGRTTPSGTSGRNRTSEGTDDTLTELVRASQELETILRTPSLRYTVVSPQEAAIIVELEDRIAMVDAQSQRRSLVNRGLAQGPSMAPAAELWLDRVELLHELVRAHGVGPTGPAPEVANDPGASSEPQPIARPEAAPQSNHRHAVERRPL